MHRRRLMGFALVLASIVGSQPWVHTAHALTISRGSGLPSVSAGTRPGPAVLYSQPPAAPQLANHDKRFDASPLLVAGADAYVYGEYLYQDYLYDDWGANTYYEDSAGADSSGDMEYPTDRKRYGGNAADLVEFRIAPGPKEVAYRITLNTLLQPDSTVVAIAFDADRNTETGSGVLPVDPGATFPGTDEVITAWGTGATHAKWSDSGWGVRDVKISTDLKANQLTVNVPRSVSNPNGKWRTTIAVGLYDPANETWLRPQTGAPNETVPGGGAADGSTSGIFNLGFRFTEHPAGLTAMDAEQASALAAGTPTLFARDIDFGALSRKVYRSSAPLTGTMVRIFPSRIATEDGKDYTATPETRGQLQQYSLYVPTTYTRSRAAGLTLMLHSLGEHHWQYNGSTGVHQVGEQRGNLVLTPEARGEDGWYQQEAEYDVFEAWNDVARYYFLHPDRAAVSGYSMGGYGTYRFASLWPDLFAKAFSTVGPPADGIWVPPLPATGGQETLTNVWLENTRNVPFLNLVALLDELVPYAGTRAQNLGAPEHGIRGFEQLGYRYRFVTYPTAEHLTLGVLSYDVPYAAEFLGAADVKRNPYHVTFSYAPATDHKPLDLVHDHAYWVSKVRLADGAEGEVPKATVDAFSHAAGRGDPGVVARRDAGVGPIPFFELGQDWTDPPKIAKENKLTLNLTNVKSVRLDVARAGIDPRKTVTLDVTATDGVTISIAAPGSGWTVKMPAGHQVLRLR